ncbi:hypothetical protein EJ05DRAFT_346401 [Pseudovirgaria hyperparasitica]|uniref:C2H2-type domain-containing protein n=1 Tax=Pseudovirgaria hyperparasitica TaxID=470096 RepID=A0A6A6W5U4_9PEZI|nr:uncharacterized protein EJ05DRAFT_346401 [Pseudovirgaria hyperparasitica]KAF2758298.1 hypothetical protein EJ05DRAFT_346401 [Pseudovirgaria hyperparasitica]
MLPASSNDPASSGNSAANTVTTIITKTEPGNNFPLPKTDKPRPHGCTTCGRSFARLEHLKRHERSHTKEKPFECPQCTRCFARRDLLLRHQQKLHKQGETSLRPRSARRESTSGMPATGSARVRKNSIAGSLVGGANPSVRPRANTISHIDAAGLNNFLATNGMAQRNHGTHGGHSHHSSMAGFPSIHDYDYRGFVGSVGHHLTNHGLPKLDTQLGLDLGGGLRTAPPIHGFHADTFEIDQIFGGGSTINPAQLQFHNSASPFQNMHQFTGQSMDEDESFDWTAGFDQSMTMAGPGPTEHAIDESSPSAMSNTTQSGFSEVMIDGSNNSTQASAAMWHNALSTPTSMVQPSFNLDTIGAAFAPELMNHMSITSPREGQDQNIPHEFSLSSPPPLPTMSPTTGLHRIPGVQHHYHQTAPLTINSESPSVGSSSMNGSARHSSITSISSDSITDTTRQALVMTLSQAQGYGHTHRKYSQPTTSSPLSSNGLSKPVPQLASLPTTIDLQRFVNAYIQYFHPHLPFLHIPTLSFDSATFNSTVHNAPFTNEGIVGGGGCLILAMAAIGALYEFEHEVATELFDSAKRLIMFYLEERRKAGISAVASQNLNPQGQEAPLWLIQAMLLNLVYGHNCGNKTAAEVATTHCAALVSLCKSCGLDKAGPDPLDDVSYDSNDLFDGDVNMAGISHSSDLHQQWLRWKDHEERKRTFYAVFVLSSLLVTAYAHQPRILNSEIRLDLPCDEDLWTANSSQVWGTLSGPTTAGRRNLSFAHALSYLLQASNRQQEPYGATGQTPLRPSTFGCYVLINALHVYIWETRNRHTSRQWKSQETDAMISQVQPALQAWQEAWNSNPQHSLERPNPFGPLSADSIPLLDCAYVRLFVDIGRTKESIWQRDFDAMADEIAIGLDELSPTDTLEGIRSEGDTNPTTMSLEIPNFTDEEQNLDQHSGKASKRERHLRRAAFFAADSLLMAVELKVTFADFTSRELPLQSAMCTFECAQVLAEWVASVQDRVGRFIGILGKDEINLDQVPAIILLEDEDKKLIDKLSRILAQSDAKLSMNEMGQNLTVPGLCDLSNYGFGSKLLMVAAYMLEKAG